MKRSLALMLIVLLLAGCAPKQQMLEETEPEVSVSQATEPVQTAPQAQPQETEGEDQVFGLDAEELILREYGETYQFNTGSIDPAMISWSSEDEAVAVVDNGVVTAIARGETLITAAFEDDSFSCSVVCNLPVLPVLNPDAGERDPVYLPPEVEIVDDAFFDDAVFVGDSQCLALYNCATYYGLLGEATYLARNSYSVDSAANNKMLMSFAGASLPLEEAIARTEAKRVFIMLGINDVGHYPLSQMHVTMENWNTIVTRIREKCPDIQICIQSLPTVWTGGETEKINNEIVCEYNAQLEKFAEENDCVFIDVAKYVKDSTGGTATVYSSDNFVHLNATGVDVWIKVLKACTEYE